MQLNGQEYVAIDPSKTARGGAMHPSLPTRPAFDVVPKEEVGVDTKKLNPTQKREKEAENMKRGVANMDAESSVDVVRNRRAIRMVKLLVGRTGERIPSSWSARMRMKRKSLNRSRPSRC
jgi:5'-3' exoribonuclease 2